MSDRVREARITAVSLAHGGALAKLLRAHGCAAEADNLEAALQRVFGIMAAELGRETLSEALRWASAEAGDAVARAGPKQAH